jgi:UDP-N-acetylmuramoyl-tripeptide--D-alanyl-D-alanine ligase
MALWTASEAAAATGGRGATDWAANGVSIDTRTIAPGDLFVALSAARDGHEFVAQALEKGAAAALVSRVPEGVSAAAPLLIVTDVQAALEAMGRAARARSAAKVVGVTGSVGKTSTKEMLRAVLSGQGRTHAAEASYNNHWGVPLTLARMPTDTEFAVIEIGMNHPGEIAPLSRIARPDVAMITTVAAAHLEAFESIDGIAREKASILEGLEPGGTAVFNTDLAVSPILHAAAEAQGASIATFGQSEGADYRITDLAIHPGVTVARGRAGGQPVLLKVASEGRHFATNAMGVLAVVEALGLNLAQALLDLAAWAPPAGRGTREEITLDPARQGEYLELIDDAFNANPTSMTAALEVLAASKPRDGVGRLVKGRRIAILGDMLELGPTELDLHAALANDPSMPSVTVVHCVGPRMRSLYEALPEAARGRWVETVQDIIPEVHRCVDAGDVVLVKGSKGSKVSLVVDVLRKLGQRRPNSETET